MEIKNLKELIDFMDEHALCELEVEEEGTRIKLKKYSGNSPVVVSQAPIVQQETKADAKDDGTIEIKSPMVGTFYIAASPESKPFVDVGSDLRSGSVVCIIEAMKLMNEIKAEVSGKVVEICVANGEPIEFGQILFKIKAT